jgi:hypothetical protein
MRTDAYPDGVRAGIERLNESLNPKNSGIDTRAKACSSVRVVLTEAATKQQFRTRIRKVRLGSATVDRTTREAVAVGESRW